MEDAQNDKAQLPGIGRDGITSGVQSSRWMQTLGRGESSQRAPQSCNENASLESDVESACNSALYSTVASRRPTARQDSEQMVCSHTEQLIAMIFQTGSGENGHGKQCAWHVAVDQRWATSWACTSIFSRFLVHFTCRTTRRHNLHPRAERHDDLLPSHQFGVHRATIPCTRPRAMTSSGPLIPDSGRKCQS